MRQKIHRRGIIMFVLTTIIIGMGVMPTGLWLRDTTPTVSVITVDKMQFTFGSDCLNAAKAFETKIKVNNVDELYLCPKKWRRRNKKA